MAGMPWGRFSDPTAAPLLRPPELDLVDRARRDEAPEGWAARTAYELARSTAQVMVPRTVAIDEAIRARPGEQLVILGAGLDGRAWPPGRRVASGLGRGSSPLAGEPTRSTWSAAAMAQLLGEHGFTVVSDDDLLTIAQRIGSPTTHERSLRNGRVATADRS